VLAPDADHPADVALVLADQAGDLALATPSGQLGRVQLRRFPPVRQGAGHGLGVDRVEFGFELPDAVDADKDHDALDGL
jgi:hypothetical protein